LQLFKFPAGRNAFPGFLIVKVITAHGFVERFEQRIAPLAGFLKVAKIWLFGQRFIVVDSSLTFFADRRPQPPGGAWLFRSGSLAQFFE
jgi:hypothetical protein